ncbi:MAG TPA: MarR family winged helix-turn-helix transcriptional regulator [Gaiellaceae bacterium]|nr:MarR family winged helix-turn-helix transcriptional regulator [Gaiellaceae bacterium]
MITTTPTTTTTTTFAPPQLEGWVSFLRAHAAITRELSAQLQREHGLTLNDYEVLLHLRHAEGGLMRRVDLAERILLTASGITRLLEGLERSGYVCKQTCSSDARVSYAKLTEAGTAKLEAAAETHLRGIDELFLGRYSGSELTTLAELLARLPVTGADCKSAATTPCS